ncbi:MAG: RtcB family protein [Clostridiaceae bacterium]|nr:RtcB family protein [Clostridiaceae bacterium]
MLEIKGRYNTAKVFTTNIEDKAKSQVMELCEQEFVQSSIIRVMPDVHAGIGCTIGTTMTIKDKVVPNLVGVDIGCGMEVIKLAQKEVDLDKLDRLIHKFIPSGFNTRSTPHKYLDYTRIENLLCKNHVNMKRARLSVGTLGGGNHFIEVNRSGNSNGLYFVVHSGSRHLGNQVCRYYQELASKSKPGLPRQLACLEGEDFDAYLHDMRIVQEYAAYNRKAIVDEIAARMGFDIEEQFTVIHNYINLDDMVLRKGAISARRGEKVIIPINMRDGSLLGIGKGNEDWNYSAPHGAGRIMSRRKAKELISLDEFRETMKGIYSTTVNKDTLDECALAYKSMDEIIENVQDTVEITDIIRPIYNFKAAE